jgi:hypothetical protein
MRKMLMTASAAAMLVAAVASCAKETKSETEAMSKDDLAKIERLGFSTQGVKKTINGYLVEGDILLSSSDLEARPTSPNMMIAQEEQYRTFNLVSPSKHPTIQVALSNTSAVHDPAFSAALDEAIARYNAEKLQITLQRVAPGTNGTDITVVAYNENSSTLGSAGFPTSTGDPYNQVKMNTFHYSTSTGTTNVNYIATIIAHELGHCIGFRHTDYMSRRYSCGYGGNEGQSSTGVGAVHIPGTPTKADPNSWMLACIGDNVNRPFNSNDKIALGYVY